MIARLAGYAVGSLLQFRHVVIVHGAVRGWARIARRAPGAHLVLGNRVRLHRGVTVYLRAPGAIVRVGERTALGRRTEIHADTEVRIGSRCAVSWDVQFVDSDQHNLHGASAGGVPIRVGDHVWIGQRSLILKGVRIGDGAVVAAGSVVTHDVPARALVAGSPARVIRMGVDWS